ncbi:MAG: PHP domain-containing protein [Clostridiales bacterium]|nr:PHP domain-containing protein [Clostridiales bacterium]
MEREQMIEAFWNLPKQQYANLLACGDPKKYDFAKYFIHTHTDLGSPKDSVLTVAKYVETAKQMGARAISVTDHGTMYAVPSLYEVCGKAGIKLLIGCEFYVCDDVEDKSKKKHTRLHLCGYAKDTEGYHVLARMVTESNTRILSITTYDAATGKKTTLDYPCISRKILKDLMGPGTPGHGHVVLTSACIGGVITGISSANANEKVNLELLNKKIRSCEQTESMRTRALAEQETLESKIAMYTDADKTEDTEREIKNLKQMLKRVKPELTKIQKEMDTITKIKKCSYEAFQVFYKNLLEERDSVQQEVIDDADIVPRFEQDAAWYDTLAGHGNFFLEIQSHGIPAEWRYMRELAAISDRLDIPMVAANDAHMQKASDLEARKIVNSLRFNNYEPPQVGDSELYLKNDVELFQALCKVVAKEHAWKAMMGREKLVEMCDVKLGKELHYPKYVD